MEGLVLLMSQQSSLQCSDNPGNRRSLDTLFVSGFCLFNKKTRTQKACPGYFSPMAGLLVTIY